MPGLNGPWNESVQVRGRLAGLPEMRGEGAYWKHLQERVYFLFWCWFFVVFQEVQVLKALVLGEEERGQSQYQVMCFVVHFNKDDFISSDAMSKLRQVGSFSKSGAAHKVKAKFTVGISLKRTAAGWESFFFPHQLIWSRSRPLRTNGLEIHRRPSDV